MKRPFLIHTPSYDENVGGIMVLHYLCHLLNEIGEQAYLYDAQALGPPSNTTLARLKQLRKELSRRIRGASQKNGQQYRTNPAFHTPLADHRIVEQSIAIYPEVVCDNPLGAKHVVRWLLFKPGFFTDVPNFSDTDLVFTFREEFNTMESTLGRLPVLNVIYLMTEIYRQTNYENRKGTCFILRKGKRENFVHHEDAIQIDGMDHEEISRLFNQCETFISYDPHTYYSTYASLCGCKSVVIAGDSRLPESPPPGIAIGFDDLERALSTRDQLFERIDQIRKSNLESVRAFVKTCRKAFD